MAGTYDVQVWWVESSNRPTNAPVDIIHAGGTNRVLINQRLPGTGWVKVFTGSFNTGLASSVIISNEGTAAGTYVIADAVRFVPTGGTVLPPVKPNIDLVAADSVAGEWGADVGRFSLVRSGPTNTALTVNLVVGGTAESGADYAALPVSVTIPAGAVSSQLLVQPVADEASEGPETVILEVADSPGYTATNLPSATVTLADRPWDDWRSRHFNTSELSDPQISGDLADPDVDGLQNLFEYASGLLPRSFDAATRPQAWMEGDRLHYSFTRAKAATDVLLELESSADLDSWSASGPPVIEEVSRDDLGGRSRTVVRLAEPAGEGQTGFLRLRIRRP